MKRIFALFFVTAFIITGCLQNIKKVTADNKEVCTDTDKLIKNCIFSYNNLGTNATRAVLVINRSVLQNKKLQHIFVNLIPEKEYDVIIDNAFIETKKSDQQGVIRVINDKGRTVVLILKEEVKQ